MEKATGNNLVYIYREIFTGFIKLVNDKAVVLGVSNRLWLFVSSVITTPLIIILFSPTLQGYYYTFTSLLGLQTLFILGLGQLIQQFVSHEWAKIDYEPEVGFTGDKTAIERLSAIKDFTVRWFSVISFLLFIGLSIGGLLFMQNSNSSVKYYEWLLPWLAISLLKSLQVLLSPGISFIEGINEVENVNRFRLSQSVNERILSWFIMIIGGKLWLFSAGTCVNILGQINFYKKKYLTILKSVFSLKSTDNHIWEKEILPLQWKFAVSALSGYLNFSFIIPLIFWYLGPISAGRAGISWAIINMFWGLSVTIIATKMPSLAIEASNKKYNSVNKTFFISTLNSTVLLVFANMFLCAGALFFRNTFPFIFERFLNPLPLVIFSLSIIPHHFRFAMVSYMRAFKKEPFWYIAVFESILNIIVLPFCCKSWGIIGLGIGFLSNITLVTVITYFIFSQVKRRLESN